jgi:hypothetical protein
MSKVLDVALGGTVNVVAGYPGPSSIGVAIERGEVVCRVTTLEAYFGRELQSWDTISFDRPLLLFGRDRDSRIPNVPTIYEYFDKSETLDVNRRVAEIILVGNILGRPIVTPPGTPAEAVRILRRAYRDIFSDRYFLGEAKRTKMSIDPTTGEDLEELIRGVMDQPQDAITRLKTLLADD